MTKKNLHWGQQRVPAIYPQLYLGLARERGISLQQLLAQTQLPGDLAESALPSLTLPQMFTLLDAIITASGDHGLGIEAGLRLPPTAFGNIGYAMLCSATIADAATLCEQYWHQLGPTTELTFIRDAGQCAVDLNLIAPFPPKLQHISYEATLASLYRGFQLLANTRPEQTEIWFACPPPPYADKAAQLLGQVRYNMPAYQFRFATTLLTQRLPLHNPNTLRQAIAACERDEALRNPGNVAVRERVRRKLRIDSQGYPSLETICLQLNMTPRTLRRHLEAEGTRFKNLLEEAKRRDAVRLLDDARLDIQRVASLLGYQDPANFTRAFRQWTGQTPSQYRVKRGLSVTASD